MGYDKSQLEFPTLILV